MNLIKVKSYQKNSRYHDSVCYCKMRKSWEPYDIVCDFPATSRDGYCDFHQATKSNAIMKPQKCEMRGCDRSFCAKIVRDEKGKDHIFCRLHFGRFRRGEDMHKRFNSRPKTKNVYAVMPYIEEADKGVRRSR